MSDSSDNEISNPIERRDTNNKQGMSCIILWILGLLITIGIGLAGIMYFYKIVRSTVQERGTATALANENATAQERGTATAFAYATATAHHFQRATPSPPMGDVTFRDDFDHVLAEGWLWRNEDKSAWRITNDGQLQIVAGEATLLSTENGQNNVLLRASPFGSFEIIARVSARPVADFQQAAIFIYQDDDNFVAINRGYCSSCVGNGVYVDNEVDGDAFSSFGIWFPTDATELYLRLVRENDIYTALFSLDGETWTEVGRVHRMLWPLKVGLGATNATLIENEDDLIAEFDYFEIREIK